MDKEQKRIYNHDYYEAHTEEIKAARRFSPVPLTTASQEAHRRASRDYYWRRKERESPEEREARLQKRRKKYAKDKKLPKVKPSEDAS